MRTILIVEDEQHLADGLKFNLELEDYDVDIAEDAETALELLASGQRRYDALVLDVMLPGMDGFQLAHELRAAGTYIPILMLTARGRAEDVLKGFESGADDYLPKPFELSIFLARVRSLLRRRDWLRNEAPKHAPLELDESPDAVPSTITVGDRTIDFERLLLTGGPKPVALTAMEAELLRYLIRNEGKIVSRKVLLADLWGLREDTDTRAIDNFVVRLRKYLEPEPSQPRYLLTVRGVGYRFVLHTS